MKMTPDEVEDYRRVTEAREWLRLGYTRPYGMEGLRKRITGQRGAEAANALIREMRRQWDIRNQWMGEVDERA